MATSLVITTLAEETAVAEAATYDQLTASIARGGDVKLTDNIFYSNGYNDGKTLKIEAGNNVTIDLNGFNLGQTIKDNGLSAAAIAVRSGAVLNIKDTSQAQTGKISACSCAVQLEGTLTLSCGNHKIVSQTELTIQNGKLVMDGAVASGNTPSSRSANPPLQPS